MILMLPWEEFVIKKALCPECKCFSMKDTKINCPYWSIPEPTKGIEKVGAEAVKTLSRFSDTYESTTIGKRNYLYKIVECPDYEEEGEK